MSLLAATCTVALELAVPCPATPSEQPPPAFAEEALPDAELARVYGTGLPAVGLDTVRHAARARYVDVALDVEHSSNQMRELFDNWSVQVAVPLIAAAAANASR